MREAARKNALSAYLDARVAEGFRVETRTDTHAIIVAPGRSRSFLDRLRRPGVAVREVISVDVNGEVSSAPAEPLRS